MTTNQLVFTLLLTSFSFCLGHMWGYEANSQVRLIQSPVPKCLDEKAVKKVVWDYSKSICKIKSKGETK